MITLLSRGNRAPKAPMNGRRRAVVVGSAVIVLAGVGVGLTSLVKFLVNDSATCVNQGVTVMMHGGPGGQCVGVTDGSYPLDPGNPTFVRVEDEIWAANHKVTTSGSPYVSVAYLMPISTKKGVEPINAVIDQLAGAYSAQVSHNAAGSGPLIQLLIASSGTDAAGYRTTVKEIETDVTTEHLVAVAGIGVSLDSTIAEVKQLAGDKIPVIGGSITSDAFNNIPNMVRVSPSNAMDVKAMLDYIEPGARTAVLVTDTNSTDSYDTTLVREFSDGYRGRFVDREAYDSKGDAGPDSAVAQQVSSSIFDMTANICANAGSVVLFAGRGRDLGTLIDELSLHCSRPITIVTGDDVVDMTITSQIRNALAHEITLEYAGEANPQEWIRGSTPVDKAGRAGFAAFSQAFASESRYVSDEDGGAMMGYDALLTAISAIDLAGPNPVPASVDQKLGLLHGARAVLGASGPINLSANYQPGAQGSNPVGKVVPILRLMPRATISLRLEPS